MDKLEWVDASVVLPERGVKVLGYDSFYSVIDTALWDDQDKGEDGKPRLVFYQTDDCEITHWMPMPDPPK